MLSFSWMTSQTSRGCTAFHISSLGFSFSWKVIRSERAVLPCYTHQLFVDCVCADYLEVLSSRSLPRLQLAVKTIPASSVAAVILYSQPHGSETMRSAFPAQCPFQAHCQWGLYAALPRPWHISSFLVRVSFCPSFYLLFSSLFSFSFLFLCFPFT